MDILYTEAIPNQDQIYKLYDCFGWNNFLILSKESLHQAMVQSWCVISAFHQDELVGTGRLVSDGIINAYLCGLVVHPNYQNQGVGSEIVQQLVNKGHSHNLHIELFCESDKIKYYEKFGFKVFASGMKYHALP
ncbi:GNAT family N-acetyltransferase [Paenibacillus sp. J2TS4]|uniref:GNAT family N-acetyltransferase n=1 Tax=Paenibacillus sp. J2TS4 TaxID=2807194 RepID=UPI001B00B9FB|nr:GNAT family N-acetyltransferase [Paenibacillus sp. J2TS4]GIP32016.1 N-acetyltransferase [Paenibacillus sp. J2TS4]